MIFVLIHSPLVGSLTWSLVADQLRQKGIKVSVPTLHDAEDTGLPYWKQHAMAVMQALEPVPANCRLVLVGHSGTGPLLPAISQQINRLIAAYVFVDAGIPRNGASRLDLRAAESPERAEQQRRFFAEGGSFPNWRDEDLADELPDAALRQRLLGELHPRGLAFWEEPIPVFEGWPDAPCAYLQFSPFYDSPAAYAQSKNWLYRELKGGHFHMLVDPGTVGNTLVDMIEQLGISVNQSEKPT